MWTEALLLLNTRVLLALLARMCHNYLESMRACMYALSQSAQRLAVFTQCSGNFCVAIPSALIKTD